MVFGSVTTAVIIGIAGGAVLGTVALWKRRGTPGWLRGVATALSIALGIAAAIVLMGAGHLVRVRPDLTTEEARLFGSTTVTFEGREVEVSARGSGLTAVVNESDRTLEVHTLVYGVLAPGAMVPPDVSIAPHSVYTVHANLDYIGPDQRPPESISTKSGGQVKYWLTW